MLGAGGVLVTTLNPVLTMLASMLIFNSKILKDDIFGIVLGLISGALIIRIWETDIYKLFQSGNFYFILASISWVCVTITTYKSKGKLSFLS